jgi:antitoxin component of MazEF toxin-antitoxin module
LGQHEKAIVVKTLRKVGNSHALLLDKPILELLGMKEGSKVNLTVTNGALVVTPVDPMPVEADKFQACLDQVMKTRHDLLKRLSQ